MAPIFLSGDSVRSRCSKTVAKWRKRDFVDDAPKEPHSPVLKSEEEGIYVAFRKHTPLPLMAPILDGIDNALASARSLGKCLI